MIQDLLRLSMENLAVPTSSPPNIGNCKSSNYNESNSNSNSNSNNNNIETNSKNNIHINLKRKLKMMTMLKKLESLSNIPYPFKSNDFLNSFLQWQLTDSSFQLSSAQMEHISIKLESG